MRRLHGFQGSGRLTTLEPTVYLRAFFPLDARTDWLSDASNPGGMIFRQASASLLNLFAALASAPAAAHQNSAPKVLLVVAHPDDEAMVAASVYTITISWAAPSIWRRSPTAAAVSATRSPACSQSAGYQR